MSIPNPYYEAPQNPNLVGAQQVPQQQQYYHEEQQFQQQPQPQQQPNMYNRVMEHPTVQSFSESQQHPWFNPRLAQVLALASIWAMFWLCLIVGFDNNHGQGWREDEGWGIFGICIITYMVGVFAWAPFRGVVAFTVLALRGFQAEKYCKVEDNQQMHQDEALRFITYHKVMFIPDFFWAGLSSLSFIISLFSGGAGWLFVWFSLWMALMFALVAWCDVVMKTFATRRFEAIKHRDTTRHAQLPQSIV